MHDAVDSLQFQQQDAQTIYNVLKHQLRLHPFGEYLKRYLYVKKGLTAAFHTIPLQEYQMILRNAFMENHTPPSFTPTTTKFSALCKNWLTQKTVRRNVVFLLGFGLRMNTEDVNLFLTKALQEYSINFQNPFEVICWYCYEHQFPYSKFKQLWDLYQTMPGEQIHLRAPYQECPLRIQDTANILYSDTALLTYLKKLSTQSGVSTINLIAKQQFDLLYHTTQDLVAQERNQIEEEKHLQFIHTFQDKLSRNDRLDDKEKQRRIIQLHNRKKIFSRKDITPSDIERLICASIPKDRHGNLTIGKASQLNEQFAGKRFSRQRICEILAGHTEVTRFDLITLQFFIVSQQLDRYPDPKTRFIHFYNSTNNILKICQLGKLYIQNPYECFILMCTLSEDPMGTYADVWELSYFQPNLLR
ncbi:hypothetical protein DW094_07275 [Ruminococcaceae bacterium AM07-15]|nr:hypothetical protein DW094_07275 [Ruminococcaceae bacterium AM07-15]